MEQVQLAQEGEAQQHQRRGGSRQRRHVQHSVPAYNYGFRFHYNCFHYNHHSRLRSNYGFSFSYNYGFSFCFNYGFSFSYNCAFNMARLEEDVEV